MMLALLAARPAAAQEAAPEPASNGSDGESGADPGEDDGVDDTAEDGADGPDDDAQLGEIAPLDPADEETEPGVPPITGLPTAVAPLAEGEESEPPPAAPPFVEEPEPPPHERPPMYETWWFWASMIAVALGITTAIIVDVTTDDPAPSDPMEPGMRPMGLAIRF